ncbi:MAG: ABC transporter ATP-binding protein [Chromatiales bacterium]|nr:ABC transporter ATP-binding protein [Chromatiales bacterium]
MSDTIIEVKDVYKCFWVGDVPFPALNGVDVEVKRGQFMVLAGRSGSGKSTLLNVIGGLELADRGTVKVCGRDFNETPADERTRFRLRNIGFVFQAYNLIGVLNAMENVAFVCQLQGKENSECMDTAKHWLTEVGLGKLLDRRPHQLSGGQQQRVAVARALAMNPALVLADEPTANLDSSTGRELIELMTRLNEDFETTFLISSHDPAVLAAGSPVIHLEDGRLLSTDPNRPPPQPPQAACAIPQRNWGQRFGAWITGKS